MFAKFKISKQEAEKAVQGERLPSTDLDYESATLYEINKLIIPDKEGIINGDLLQNWCFPIDEKRPFKVFISHSSEDRALAIKLARYIEREHNVRCFVDSSVWKNAYDILWEIDKTYSHIEGEKINYIDSSYAAAHVFSMLSTALFSMINQVECCLLIESENSVLNLHNIQERTLSPWIYQEITLMNLIQVKIPKRPQENQQLDESIKYFSQQPFRMSHPLDTSSFKRLTAQNITEDKSDWLSYLYWITAHPEFKAVIK